MKEQHGDYHNAEQIRPTNKYKYPIQRKHTTEAMDISCITLPQSINKNNQIKTKNWLLTPRYSNIIKKINTPHLEPLQRNPSFWHKKTTNLTSNRKCKTAEKKPIFIPFTKASTFQVKQLKKQLNIASKILKKLPGIRIIFFSIIQVKNSKNVKEKELKEAIDEID